MIFRQLFDLETSTYSYLLADGDVREAVLIDPVLERIERDASLLRELELHLLYTLETHVHADHVTAASGHRDALGSKVAVGAATGVRNPDLLLRDGERLRFGRYELEVRATPGHTSGCVTYVEAGAGVAFTGDALLIRGCGRTDFQGGDARTLFRSVRQRIFSLPDDTLLYPAHDYAGRCVTTVGEEKRWNRRLGLALSETRFVELMAALRLAYPKRIDVAVPSNLQCGVLVPAAPAPLPSVGELLEQRGREDVESWLGSGI
jgi:glyoxylase-like metal-dependent hydrolase (beta-lactamase superfamily II)